jgi:hypothetical protein
VKPYYFNFNFNQSHIVTSFFCPADFDDHKTASYDLAMGLEEEQEKKRKEERRLSQNEFSELIKRNTDAFVSGQVDEDSDFEEDPDEEGVVDGTDGGGEQVVDPNHVFEDVMKSDTPQTGSTSSKEGSVPRPLEDPVEVDEEPAHQNSDDLSGDEWAKTFMWADEESVVAR